MLHRPRLRHFHFLSGSLLAPIALLAACSSQRGAPTGRTSGAIANGQADTDGRYSAVVRIAQAAPVEEGRPPSICTATFVSARMILSGAHCFVDSQGAARDAMAYAGNALDRVYVHPDYARARTNPTDEEYAAYGDQPYRAFDLAIAVLDRDAAPATVEIADAVPAGLARALIVGFGYSQVNRGEDGADVHGGDLDTRRFGFTPVTAVGAIIESAVNFEPAVADGAIIGSGDSGGPMFAEAPVADGGLGPGPLRQIAVASGSGGQRFVVTGYHTNLTSAPSARFFDWLAAAPRCLALAGRVRAADCAARDDDGRLAVPPVPAPDPG
jgi:hypothetical protein